MVTPWLWCGPSGTNGGTGRGRWLRTIVQDYEAAKAEFFGATPWDPLTFTVAPFALLAIALTAACIPALRAARVDPLVAYGTNNFVRRAPGDCNASQLAHEIGQFSKSGANCPQLDSSYAVTVDSSHA